MSDVRSLLNRVAEGAKQPEDAFDRLQGLRARRHRNRRITAGALALAVAAGGAFGAFAAFHHESTPRPPHHVIGGSASRFVPVLWPENTIGGLRDAQERVASGADQWRLDPMQTARHFAQDVLGWQNVFITKTEAPQTRTAPFEVHMTTCDPTGEGSCSFDGEEGLNLERVMGSSVYSVTGAFSPRLLLSLQPGTLLPPPYLLRVDSSLPDGTRVLAESVRTSPEGNGTLGVNDASVRHAVLHLCAQGSFIRGGCVLQPTSRAGVGYVAFVRFAGESEPQTMVTSLDLFSPDTGSLFNRSAILDLTAVPVRFASSGTFESCPSIQGTKPPGPDPFHKAARVALRFSNAWAAGDRDRALRYVDPSARDLENWAVSGEPKQMGVSSSGSARDDILVQEGCGPEVATRSWKVVVDDGTSSASLDFTLYLVRRSGGWKVWGSY